MIPHDVNNIIFWNIHVVTISAAFSVGSFKKRVIIVCTVSVLDGSVIVDSLICFRYFVLFFYFCLLMTD